MKSYLLFFFVLILFITQVQCMEKGDISQAEKTNKQLSLNKQFPATLNLETQKKWYYKPFIRKSVRGNYAAIANKNGLVTLTYKNRPIMNFDCTYQFLNDTYQFTVASIHLSDKKISALTNTYKEVEWDISSITK